MPHCPVGPRREQVDPAGTIAHRDGLGTGTHGGHHPVIVHKPGLDIMGDRGRRGRIGGDPSTLSIASRAELGGKSDCRRWRGGRCVPQRRYRGR